MKTIRITALADSSSPATAHLDTPAKCLSFADTLAFTGGDATPNPFQAEAVLLRLLRRVRETAEGAAPVGLELTPAQLEVCVETLNSGGDPCLVRVPVTSDGDFNTPYPGGFYDWRSGELF